MPNAFFFGIKWIINQERALGILARSLEIEDPFAVFQITSAVCLKDQQCRFDSTMTELQTLSHELKDVRENSDHLKNSFSTQRS